MKRHLLGFVILIVAIAIGLILSPIRFDEAGTGHGIVKDGGGSYWFNTYKSMYFVRLTHEGEQYETTEKAKEVFQKRLEKPETEEISSQEVLERSETRGLIHFQRKDNLEGYCIIRVEKNGLRYIYSTSLWHVLEFEKQNY